MAKNQTTYINLALAQAQREALRLRHEFILPEHLLLAFLQQKPFQEAMLACFRDAGELAQRVWAYLSEQVEQVPEHVEYQMEPSEQLNEVVQHAHTIMQNSETKEMKVPHLVQAILMLPDSWAATLLQSEVGDEIPELLKQLIIEYELSTDNGEEDSEEEYEEGEMEMRNEPWRNFVTCLNEVLAHHNPLIGRREELERTIQVLCRKEKKQSVARR